MGIGGISIWQLLIILAILVLLFGTTRLRSLGGDLGTAIKGFKDSMKEEEDPKSIDQQENTNDTTVKSESTEKQD